MPNGDGKTLVGGLIRGRFKLLVGAKNKFHEINQNTLTGPLWPNKTVLVPLAKTRVCGRTPSSGCLFDIFSDPQEMNSIAVQNSSLFQSMLASIDKMQGTVYSPDRGVADKRACEVAESRYDGYWGPFVGV